MAASIGLLSRVSRVRIPSSPYVDESHLAVIDIALGNLRLPLTRREYDRVKSRMTPDEMLEQYATSMHQIMAYNSWDTAPKLRKRQRNY